MAETCSFCEDYDPVTEEPLGPRCGQPAVELLVWDEGLVSAACEVHGKSALEGRGRDRLVDVLPIEDASSAP